MRHKNRQEEAIPGEGRADSAADVSPGEYIDMVLAKVRELGAGASVVVDHKTMVARGPLGGADLRAAYAEYLIGDESERRENIRKAAATLAPKAGDMPATPDELTGRLLPRVRGRAAECRGRLSSLPGVTRLLAGSEPERTLLGDHLAVSVVMDMPDGMATLDTEQFDAMGMDLTSAMAVATENLRRREPAEFVPIQPGLYCHQDPECYAGSQLLVPEAIAKLNLGGNPVAVSPNRTTLLVTGSGDDRGLQAMLYHSLLLARDPSPVSPVPVEFSGGSWRTFRPPAGHRMHEPLAMLELDALGADFDLTMAELEGRYPGLLTGVWISSIWPTVAHGRMTSSCEMATDSPSLLPAAAYVTLRSPGADAAPVADWASFAAVMGPELRKTALWPETHLLKRAPDAGEIDRMRALCPGMPSRLPRFAIATAPAERG